MKGMLNRELSFYQNSLYQYLNERNRKRIFDPTLIIFHIRSYNFYMALHLSFATFIIRACLLALTKGKPTLHISATLLVVLYSYIIIYECVRIFVTCLYCKKLG